MEAKKAIWIWADLKRSVIGTISRMGDDLAGVAVLTRTVSRALQAGDCIDEITVFCPSAQLEAVQGLLPVDNKIKTHPLQKPLNNGAAKFRKWSLPSWRGGLGEMTWFDELRVSREMIQFGIENKHHVVMVLPGDAPLLDAELVRELFDHYEQVKDSMRFVFCQAPPGLCGCIYRLDILHEIEQAGMTVGNVLAYNPDMPHSDQIVQDCTYKVPKQIYYCFSRFLADNWRSWQLLADILSNNDPATLTAGRLAELAAGNSQTQDFPGELEIEINTRPSLRYRGYPHTHSGERGEMSLAAFGSIIDQCRGYDDVCLTIGGFGEPLAHRDITAMVKAARQGGIFGINIETDGLLLTEKMTDELLEAGVDIVSVWVDAWSQETYDKVKPAGGNLAQVTANIEHFISRSVGTGSIVVPCLTKTALTLADMEDFYDQWRRKRTVSVISGHNSYCGSIADENVMNMAPPARHICRQLRNNALILADGNMVLCCEDHAGKIITGNVQENDITTLWQSPVLHQIRAEQAAGNYNNNDLCRNCQHWYR
ncbi:MAG: SPASM domain-containing protein [Sedimentisphaerales bacterium]|nr:SPASM domain-containing protein [Sedimentisphaerales bacterium]